MRYLKRIIIFVGALVAVFSIYGSDISAVAVGDNSPNPELTLQNAKPAASTPTPAYYAAQLEKSGIKINPGTAHREDSKETPEKALRCKSNVYKTLLDLPYSHRQQLRELTLFYSNEGRRGLGGGSSIVLRCTNVTDKELTSVLTHEIAHLVDASLFVGTLDVPSGFYDFGVPVMQDDPSLFFYRISWDTDTSLRWGVTKNNFVSLYAMTDPFEDFAETYTFFRWHGPEFRVLRQTDSVLAEKYDFMKNYVFSGREYGDLDYFPKINARERSYDVTVLPIL